MTSDTSGGAVGQDLQRLSRWRLKSPLMQLLVICVVIFLTPGINAAILGLGAGGSHPENIPLVDKTNIVGSCTTIIAGIFGGSLNNKIGPRYSMMIAVPSYPIWAGSLWWLDRGSGSVFAYIAAIYHGIGAGLIYSTTGFIVSSYSTEANKGRYIAAFWASVALGSVASAVIILGIIAHRSARLARVPQTVYLSIILIECVGVLCTALLVSPAKIRRNDGRAIAIFKSTSWKEELKALARNIISPEMLLLGPAFLSCNMPVSFAGSLNGFYFNARTRALVNLTMWSSVLCGWVIIAWLCDAKFLGSRQRRVWTIGIFVAIFLTAAWTALMHFLATHTLDRHQKPKGVDWHDGATFGKLYSIYVFLGCSWALFQGYIAWIYATFSNEPSKLSQFSGILEAMRALGLAIAFAIDSKSTPFLTEAAAYFSLMMFGLLLCIICAVKYTAITMYGAEDLVVIPSEFDTLIAPLPIVEDQSQFHECKVAGQVAIVSVVTVPDKPLSLI